MTSPAWFPDELEWAGQEHLDPDYVEGYDRKAGFDPEPDLALLARFGFGAASELVPIKSDEFPAAARRPRNSVREDRKARTLLGTPMPQWQALLGAMRESA